MSRIDDALKRLTGRPADAPKGPILKGFASETKGGTHNVPLGSTLAEDRRLWASLSTAARQTLNMPADGARVGARVVVPGNRHLTPADLDPTDDVFSLRQIVHYVGYAGRAILRHKMLVVVAFVLSFALTVLATKLIPRTYEIEVKLLAQRNAVMASLSNPGRAVPYDADAPTRAAAETILRRDNVISLIRQTNLMTEWDRTRAPILQWTDRLQEKIRGRPLTLDDKLDNLVEQIERRMEVTATTDADGLVKIYLAWPDAHAGYLLVDRAQHAFIEARQIAETQAIGEAIKVLESYAASLGNEIQTTLGELGQMETRVLAHLAATSAPRLRTPSSARRALAMEPLEGLDGLSEYENPLVDPATLADPRLTRLKTAVSAKRWELTRLEEEQKRKLKDLETQLRAAQQIYTPNHPTVQSLQQNLAAYQYQSPQVLSLRTQLDRLESESDDQAAADAERLIRAELSRRSTQPRPARPRAVAPVVPMEEAENPVTPDPGSLATPRRDSVVEFATLRLRTELSQLRSILERTDAARIELAVSQAASKHRYTVIQPAEEPGDPSFPDTRHVLMAGFLASIVFALASAIAADILSKRILEPWQVQRQLGLPMLGIVRPS